MGISTSTGRRAAGRRARIRGLAAAVTPAEWTMVAAVVAFVVISVVWLSLDGRVPDADSGKHLLNSFAMYDGLAAGHPRTPLILDTGYPPLVYLVGAAGVLVGGVGRTAPILAENLVFVPLLAGGCYLAGRLAYSREVGVLAALFALATPMIISLFHLMMLDAPVAALVAISVGLLIASRRFERVGISALAGAACGLGALTKQTFPLFVAGFLAVMLVRGGWRNWRGALVFASTAVVLAAPWYLQHASDVAEKTSGATAALPPIWYGTVAYPERWSVDNFTWYGWALANNILYLPLLCLFAIGVVFAVRRLFDSERRGWEPELLAGALVSYVSISFLRLDDPRYVLPFLVYVAVIGTAWARPLGRIPGSALAVAVVAVLVLNTVLQNVGLGSVERIAIGDPPGNPIGESTLVVISPDGYVVGEPDDGVNQIRALLRGARADGAARVAFDQPSVTEAGFHPSGLAVEARLADLVVASKPSRLEPRDAYLFAGAPGSAPACARTPTRAIFLTRGGPPGPRNPVDCPDVPG